MVVLGGPAESHTERPGERRLDDAGVGAGMTGGVAVPGPHRARRRSADQRRADHHQRRGHPGTDVVGQHRPIVLRPNRIGRTAGERCPIIASSVLTARYASTAGTPPSRRPQQRRHLGVGGVLRDRFQCGAGQARPVQQRRIASAQRRQQPSRSLDIAARPAARAIVRPVRASDVPPSDIQVAAAVTAATTPTAAGRGPLQRPRPAGPPHRPAGPTCSAPATLASR